MAESINRDAIRRMIEEAGTLKECLAADILAEEANRERATKVDALMASKGWSRAQYEAASREEKAELPVWLDTKPLTEVCIALAKGKSDPELTKVMRRLAHNSKFLTDFAFWRVREELRADSMRADLLASFGGK